MKEKKQEVIAALIGLKNSLNNTDPLQQETQQKIITAINNIASEKCHGACLWNEIANIHFFITNAIGFKQMKLNKYQQECWENFKKFSQSPSEDSWKGLSIL